MSILFNNQEEIRKSVKEEFENTNNYLVAIKHNDLVRGTLKLLLSDLFYTLDSTRTFIINFNKDGIYEKEISNSMKRDFLLMPWSEVKDLEVISKNNRAIIKFKHIGKYTGYEIPFKGKIFKDNEKNLNKLTENDFNRIL